MACKIDAKFNDLLEKVYFEPEQKLCMKAVCCDNMDVLTYVLTGETGYFPLIWA